MKKVFLIIAALFLSACSKPTPQEQVTETIEHIITAIDNDDRQQILDKYVYMPDKNITPDDLSQKRLQRLKNALVKAKETIPEISENNTVAIINLHLENYNKKMKFIYNDDQWRLVN